MIVHTFCSARCVAILGSVFGSLKMFFVLGTGFVPFTTVSCQFQHPDKKVLNMSAQYDAGKDGQP